MNLLQNPRSLKKVWYFISKNQPCLWTFQSTQELSWSHSQSVSSSVGITNSCSLLAFPFSQDEICYARSVSSLSSVQYTAVSLRGTYMHTHCYLLLQNNSLLDTGIIQPAVGKATPALGQKNSCNYHSWLSLLLQICMSSACILLFMNTTAIVWYHTVNVNYLATFQDRRIVTPSNGSCSSVASPTWRFTWQF